MANLDFWDVLEGRCSVRRFQARPVERQVVEKLLEAGTRAPNAHNNQSWRFVVLTEKDSMVQLAEAMQPDYVQALVNSGMPMEKVSGLAEKRKNRLISAPVAVIVCVAQNDLVTFDDEDRSRGEGLMAIQSAAMAGGHILLAAHALGLGGVWMCAPMFVPETVQAVLDLDTTWLPQGMLLIGYPDEQPVHRKRKPLSEVVKWVS